MNYSQALVLDLETAAIDRAPEFVETPTAPSNYKDEAKIAAYVADAKQAAIDKCGLDPDLGRIVCLGWMLEGRDIEPIVVPCRAEVDEAVALREFWKEVLLPNGSHRRIVTFNGLGFDLPFLMRRSLYLGVVYPHLNIDRYRTPHIDLCARLSFNGVLKPHSLRFYAKRFSLPIDEDPVIGSDIPHLIRDGSDTSWRAIQNHCKSDVRTTYLLASRLQYIDYDETVDPRDRELSEAVGF
jgi:hypothetical protein